MFITFLFKENSAFARIVLIQEYVVRMESDALPVSISISNIYLTICKSFS